MTKPYVLVVDDEADFARGLARLCQARLPDIDAASAFSAEQALELAASREPAVVLTDLRMPGMDGFGLLAELARLHPQTSTVMLTAHGSVEAAVAALKAGAYDFLEKPVSPGDLERCLSKGLERHRLLAENTRLKKTLAQCARTSPLLGTSDPIKRLREAVEAVAATDYTVLITGESGTGKELVARGIHDASPRQNGPLVCVNCPAIPSELLESELFGHVKGAFTGADKANKGLFTAADHGSILLDEIGDIEAGLQTKLLRVLQDRLVRPVGATTAHAVDVRILASTNQDLETKIAAKRFREDLFYRLNVLSIRVPTLRERREDIPILAQAFLDRACREMNQPEKRLAPEVLAALSARDWPGNVRELSNMIRRLAVFSTTDTIDSATLGVTLHPADQKSATAQAPYHEAKEAVLERFTRDYITDLLTRTGGNVSEAARSSGLERVSLQKILKRLGIEAERFRR